MNMTHYLALSIPVFTVAPIRLRGRLTVLLAIVPGPLFHPSAGVGRAAQLSRDPDMRVVTGLWEIYYRPQKTQHTIALCCGPTNDPS